MRVSNLLFSITLHYAVDALEIFIPADEMILKCCSFIYVFNYFLATSKAKQFLHLANF